jgi:hypothetical protein
MRLVFAPCRAAVSGVPNRGGVTQRRLHIRFVFDALRQHGGFQQWLSGTGYVRSPRPSVESQPLARQLVNVPGTVERCVRLWQGQRQRTRPEDAPHAHHPESLLRCPKGMPSLEGLGILQPLPPRVKAVARPFQSTGFRCRTPLCFQSPVMIPTGIPHVKTFVIPIFCESKRRGAADLTTKRRRCLGILPASAHVV